MKRDRRQVVPQPIELPPRAKILVDLSQRIAELTRVGDLVGARALARAMGGLVEGDDRDLKPANRAEVIDLASRRSR